jgi:hypothetical protein
MVATKPKEDASPIVRDDPAPSVPTTDDMHRVVMGANIDPSVKDVIARVVTMRDEQIAALPPGAGGLPASVGEDLRNLRESLVMAWQIIDLIAGAGNEGATKLDAEGALALGPYPTYPINNANQYAPPPIETP